MRKPLKILLAVLSVIAVIFIGITIFIKIYLTDERVRSLVSGMAEKSLHRKVSLGEIRVGLLRGIVVKDFVIKEKDSEGVFIGTKDFILKFQLLPLFSKRLVIDELSIVDSEIHVKKNADGSYNLSDIAGPAKTEQEKGTKTGASSIPLALDIKSISIKNANLKYEDLSAGSRKAVALLDAKMGVSGISASELSSDGKLDIKLLEMEFNGEKKPTKNMSAALKYNIGIDMASKKLTVHSIDADIMKIPLNIQGVVDYSGETSVSLDIKSSMINLDEIVQTAEAGTPANARTEFAVIPAAEAAEQAKTPGSSRTEFEPMNIKMKAGGAINIDKIKFRGLSINNLKARYELKNNVFRISDLSGNTLNGGFTANAQVDLGKRGTQYSMDANINGMKLEDMVNSFAPKAKDKLFGSLYSKASISGAGTVPENIKQNLKGKGNFSIKDGVIKNAELSTGLLAFLGLQNLKEIQMQKADGDFTISDRVINLVSLITSKDLILDEKGTIGLDERLDIRLNVKVSEKLTPTLISKSTISQFLSEDQGWSSIPLKIGGTVSNPSYNVDTAAVGKKATETIKKKIGEELFKSITKDKQKPAGTQEKKEATPEDLIKGIFGK